MFLSGVASNVIGPEPWALIFGFVPEDAAVLVPEPALSPHPCLKIKTRKKRERSVIFVPFSV
jgi:hypothetical protein